MPIIGLDFDLTVNKAMKILQELQTFKKNTTIRFMGYMLIKILKTKLQGLYVNERKLLMVI